MADLLQIHKKGIGAIIGFIRIKLNVMKNLKRNIQKLPKQPISNKPMPEIRDDLDSRQRKELGHKGDTNEKGDIEK